MTKRELAISKITSEVGKHGMVTREAMRTYVESSISYTAYENAVKRGFEIFKNR